MNRLFYDEWKQKRLEKIISLFGRDWFAFKRVLELGACYGDIGFELMKLGAEVTFTEGRQKNIDALEHIFKQYNIKPNVKLLDQNELYTFDRTFDLTLHMGVLYHIENWQQDLKCALNTSKIVLLETVVNPKREDGAKLISVVPDDEYEGMSNKCALLTQETIEDYVSSLGCKFVRLDTADLNTSWSWLDTMQIRNVYDWKYRNVSMYNNPASNCQVHYRRMWLILT
jgi:hypothetical protein